MVRFELWITDQRGTLSIPRERHGKNDHGGFASPHCIKGWARIERRVVVLFRTDKGEPTPSEVRRYYAARFPKLPIEDRYEQLLKNFTYSAPTVRPA